ncbi:lipoate--protein ligase family protein [Paenibacillus thiaminolyticus]|uniref:Lipoate--protein ligase family protein n=1 Tax=Paenibacillus thiaminolyticus TaxID=49283 RepID=A0ABT4FZF7_PANTH|nr:biotin/lipoate A/B protein ligase family protein [Paenibacillus thiaminolyticus]MCY9536381.1 lipoate--protein ligase family protein [Paenibacillus thiaminolyticus]MCY9601393.1 lipoate--protein ligase family protein [Paenibacillus thiaminolyticus]MCY9609285.1 lipoate--protein ligase family protein [Paenibacillus thiaminolyticus]MCY9613048.1 lipoate--protein ligase family protein [Paenibacillus thiaminolyticus]MCY9616968.1 lipoate--protein ligase family protein [Paenibacillus thiaminolyticus]
MNNQSETGSGGQLPEDEALDELVLGKLNDVLLLDRTNDWTEPDPLYPFALDELLCRQTGRGGPPLCHLWRHPRAFILGQRDSRLPQAAEALRWLESLGYATAVRNTGGAAVPLDSGVVNLSLILPKQEGGDKHFHGDFERMYRLIRRALQHTCCRVDKGEVEGAYCPGDFDLSIGGRKFCGIAQRRQANAFIVQAFVIAGGSGRDSAGLVREFYARATAGGTERDYPRVAEESTASLEEAAGLGGEADAAEAFTAAVKRVIRERQTEQGITAAAAKLHLPEPDEVRAAAAELRRRYGIQDNYTT